MNVTMTGGCLCGAVRYAATVVPLMVRACWCRVCQHLAAGSATVNAVFPREAVSVQGELADYASLADSGSHMHRRFCPRCGVHLFSEADERPHLLVVRAGTLDDPSQVKPEMLIWTASAPPWATLDPTLPQHPGQPPAPALAPQKSTFTVKP